MAAATSNSKVKLKLLIDKKCQKVLFAEASKDFVDFLFSLMSFPLGNVIRLLTKSKMVGCLGNLYGSIESLSDTYLQPTQKKDFILKPKTPLHANIEAPLLLPNAESFVKKIYECASYHRYVSFDPNIQCPSCNNRMSYEAVVVASKTTKEVSNSDNEGGGFVKDVVTYMIMDNLEVKPMSTISSITLINTFKIADLSPLEEKMVDVGVDEGFKLLQVSLHEKNALTSVFLKA